MKYNSKRHIAFTLAETLLMMVIIGVVTSILIRTVVRVDPDKDKFMFIRGYKAIEEIVVSSINDATRYDQNHYTKKEIEELKDNRVEMHIDLNDKPLNTAQFTIISNGTEKTVCPQTTTATGTTSKCDEELNKQNAVCYYVAEHINVIGAVDCSGESGLNMTSSIGVSYYDLTNWRTNSEGKDVLVFSIQPTSSSQKYKVAITPKGGMYVPNENNDELQTKAQNWMKNPLQLDD